MAQVGAMEGNGVSGGFQVDDDKDAAVRMWQQLLARCAIDDQVLAAEVGMSRSNFSKVSTGVQGDLLGLVFRVGRRHPELKRAFLSGLAEREQADPIACAADELASAALRFLKVCGAGAAAAGGGR